MRIFINLCWYYILTVILKSYLQREDWETDHFERLNRKGAARAVGVDFEEPSPQQKEAIKRNIVFLSLLAAIGLILYFMDRTL